jgi:hypothetical protein
MRTGVAFSPTGEPMGNDLLPSISLLVPISSKILASPLLCLPPDFTLVSCLAYFSNTKMEATCSSDTSVDRTHQNSLIRGAPG